MVYDIVCLVLMMIAFTGGYQNGIVGSFSFFFSLICSLIITSMIAPFLSDFLTASYAEWTHYLTLSTLLVIGLVLTWLLYRLLSRIRIKPLRPVFQILRKVLGGTILAGLMILSISIFTSFTVKAHILTPEMLEEAHVDDWMKPINEKASLAWSKIRSGAVHKRSTTSVD